MNREVITSIEEYTTKKDQNPYSESYSGYKITTSNQEIELLIYDGQECCEYWGYLLSEDDFSQFIGAELLAIVHVDQEYNSKVLAALEEVEETKCEGVGTVFINIETNRGILQFTAYNAHNGYYGHRVLINSTQLTLDETI